jgi:hypothetical protein
VPPRSASGSVPQTARDRHRDPAALRIIGRMTWMLLIVEPVGQRAERGEAAGRAVYQRMLDFADELKRDGVLLGVSSLVDTAAAARVQRREGRVGVVDGPFAEAKEMVGGFFLLDVATREQALAIAARCPAAEWATVEVRETGPCWMAG